MVTFPFCKINLGLNILGRRPDGYHNIETCFYPVPWQDVLEVVPAKNFSLQISGASVPGPSAENLCVKAYQLLNKRFKLRPVTIVLHKVLPLGAGLGGGSSDGAHTLIALNELFQLGLGIEELASLATSLGSDCAFFLYNKPMIGVGRGESLSDIKVSLKGKYLFIAKPEVSISTADAYSMVTPSPAQYDLRKTLEEVPVKEWKGVLKNDFEPPLFNRFPIIEALKQKLYATGALYASMSGSGSAVYGIFEEPQDLKNEFAGMTCWTDQLN